MQTDIAITDFGPEHIDGALELSRAVGWPHRTEDWDLLRSLSKGVVALENGRVAATALATPFGPVGTLNMIIVDEALRGRGLGRKIMEEAMARATPSEWRLVATSDGLPLYQKLGFQACGEVQQFQGPVCAPDSAEALAPEGEDGLGWAALSDANALADLDRIATGMDRISLVLSLLRFGRVLVHREKGDIVAWAALRPFGRGQVAGPVIARGADEAKRLLSVLFADCAGTFLRVDTTIDTDLGPWLVDHGLEYSGGGISMHRGGIAAAPKSHRSFALAAQALG